MLPSLFMAKFKPARGKAKAGPAPQGALPCVVLVIAGILLIMMFMWWVLRNAGG